jgi:hypothetical protein
MTVFHFTDTARLPWILDAGELRPGRNKIGNFPSPDFLWATTDGRGDRTASAYSQSGIREGLTRAVRFTLAAGDFEPWPEITGRFPQWVPEQVGCLERLAKLRGVLPTCWRCRTGALPSGKWIRIETKAYTGSWQELRDVRVFKSPGVPGALGVVIDGAVYASVQKEDSVTGALAYAAAKNFVGEEQ